jgi:hypothetical protein
VALKRDLDTFWGCGWAAYVCGADSTACIREHCALKQEPIIHVPYELLNIRQLVASLDLIETTIMHSNDTWRHFAGRRLDRKSLA